MSKDYLLDTNVIAYYAEMKTGCKSEECRNLEDKLAKLSQESKPKLLLCSINIGEIEYGLDVAESKDTYQQKLVRDLIPLFSLQDIDIHIAKNYGVLRSRLFNYCAPRKKKQRGSDKKRIEEWIDPATSKELQIQENDLWIAAVAMTYNLILVTHDAMRPIRAIAGSDIEFDDWLV
jgi:predicted nucleic acid-binding protein